MFYYSLGCVYHFLSNRIDIENKISKGEYMLQKKGMSIMWKG